MLNKLLGSGKLRHARATWFLILLALLVPLGLGLLLWPSPPALAQSLPHVLSGSATIDGRLAPDGTEVTAVVDGQAVARANVSSGKYTLLIVPARGQSFVGKPITFTVGDSRAKEKVIYKSGTIAIFNLTGDSSLSVVVGDLNGDGQVTIVDLAILSSVWGLGSGSPQFNADADLNGSGTIDQPDLDTLMRNYQWGQ